MANNRRNITHKLILSILIICLFVSPVFASTPEIEIEHNDNEYFHAYNSNTNVANSYIDSGAAVFSKAMNYMFINIAKSTSSVYSIQGIANNMYSKLSSSDTTLTNIATDIGVLKQSNASQTTLLSSISSNSNSIVSYIGQISSTLGGTTTGNLVDIKNALNNINTLNWNNRSIYVNTDRVSSLSSNTSTRMHNAGTHLYVSASNNGLNTNESYLMCFYLPFRYGNNGVWEVYDFDTLFTFNGLNITYGSNTSIASYTKYDVEYYAYTDGEGYYFYILNPSLYTSDSYMTLDFTCKQSIYYNVGNNFQKLFYMTQNNPDYYTVSDFLIAKSNNSYLHTIANNGIEASFDDSDIIDAINNLSLQDNDVKLNLTINNNTGSDGTDIITRLQNFFDTGVSVSDFFDNVDDAESGWFTQSNSDVINTLRGGYTNFYE